jgi:hypothetical protein
VSARPIGCRASFGGRQDGTLDAYRRHLSKLVDLLERNRPDVDVREVTTNDCRAFLDNWRSRKASTVCTIHSAVNGLFEWLFLEGEVEVDPMTRIKRPRRPRPGEADVVIVSADDVGRMFMVCQDWGRVLVSLRAGVCGCSARRGEPTALARRRPVVRKCPPTREGRQGGRCHHPERTGADPSRGLRVWRGSLRVGRLRDPESTSCKRQADGTVEQSDLGNGGEDRAQGLRSLDSSRSAKSVRRCLLDQ